jgi:hypothetical protein
VYVAELVHDVDSVAHIMQAYARMCISVCATITQHTHDSGHRSHTGTLFAYAIVLLSEQQSASSQPTLSHNMLIRSMITNYHFCCLRNKTGVLSSKSRAREASSSYTC